jgi:hypothetical protein
MDTFPYAEVGRESISGFLFSSNRFRFFARNILPKTMSFEPSTHILRPSLVIRAIENDDDRLGIIFGVWESGMRYNHFFFCVWI